MALKEPHTLPEALEALETLAHLDDYGDDLESLLAEPQPVEGSEVEQWAVHWVQEHGTEQTMLLVRQLFRIVLGHLQGETAQKTKKSLRGLATVMKSVDAAAERLDRVTALFYGARENLVTHTDEYRHLQQYYHTQIEQTDVEDDREPVEIPNPEGMTALQRILVDVDYELYGMRRDDGLPFLTPELKESAELAADFGLDLESFTGDDPLIWVLSWKDELLHKKARVVLHGVWEEATEFYRQRRKAKRGKLSDALSAAMMALMLAAKPSNLLIESAKKAVYRYFYDFQQFLRRALQTGQYGKLVASPPEGEWDRAQRALLHGMCYQLVCQPWEQEEVSRTINRIIQHEELPAAEASVAEQLRSDYEALVATLEQHPNGPLFKMLDAIREEEVPPFDPWLEGNIPGWIAEVQLDGTSCNLLRFPTPMHQPVLSKPTINEELFGFLRCHMLRGDRKGQLLLNLQSRSGWQEEGRSSLLEQLQESPEVAHHLAVVTLAVDSPFYQQSDVWADREEADLFLNAVESELCDPAGSYYIPDYIRQALVPAFLRPALAMVHQTYFSGAETLNRSQRQTLIDLLHFFLTIKLLDLYRPERFAFVCKDGVDRSPVAASGLLLGLALVRGQEFSRLQHRTLIHAPALLFRERGIQPYTFERYARFIEALETHSVDPQTLSTLYHAVWWHE